MGPSGCGKTELAKNIIRQRRIDVHFDRVILMYKVPDKTAYGALMEMYRNMELVQGVPEDLGLQYFDKEQRNL